MADSEKAYYTAKLDMEKKEHEIRMKILLLLLWTLYVPLWRTITEGA